MSLCRTLVVISRIRSKAAKNNRISIWRFSIQSNIFIRMKNSQGRYFRYSSFLKSRFHSPVRKISVDAGFSCPNREGSFSIQGCIYCNNDAFSPARQVSGQTVQQQVLQAIEHRSRAERPEKYIVYFQPFTNTYAPVKQLEVLYREAFCHPDVVGIAIGT